MFGRYALYDAIASGGMATVHFGRQVGAAGFSRTVAIKRLHAQFAQDPEFVSMFLDEARLAARISHPNVVPTLDVVDLQGELFLVMEYVRGESLARLSRAAAKLGSRIPFEMVVTLMVGVLHGLHAAHEARSELGDPLGIVHRDVSPQNILIGVDGAARVLDFGIAKSMGQIQTAQEGQLKGKLSYMAPEQIRGDVSRSSDVYAAAIVLWELLTGRRLFLGDDDAQIIERVRAGCTTPPSALVPGLSPALDAVVLRGLSLDPAGRYATAREMALALEDTVPPVAASKIGEWVESMMTETLSERTSRISAIESDSSIIAPPVPSSSADLRARMDLRTDPPPPFDPPPSRDSALPWSADPEIPIVEQTASSSTRLSTGSASTFAPPSESEGGGAAPPFASRRGAPRRDDRGGPARGDADPSRALPAGPSAAETSASVPPPPIPAVPAEPPAAAASPAIEGSAAGATPKAEGGAPAVSSAPVVAVAPSVAAPAAHRAPGGGSGSSRCNPPWYVDARGVRLFKKECL